MQVITGLFEAWLFVDAQTKLLTSFWIIGKLTPCSGLVCQTNGYHL